jgi:glycogen(starch) synthase
MKVLMYGWEYPPHITGGLGTACFGIIRSLAEQNVEILFVVPKTYGDEESKSTTLQNAGDIPSKYLKSDSIDFWKKVMYKEISAKLIPYIFPEEYMKKPEESVFLSLSAGSSTTPDFLPFSGKYGTDLWKEIERFSFVTSILAEKEFYDIIHAHEWMTFPAAIEAKKISKKPLIVHIHATEFDRSGQKINRDIYNIEKNGMNQADKIITVSNYTRNIIINHYNISPEKIVTVHNAVEKCIHPVAHKLRRLSDEKIVTFLGRITYQKGPEYFIEAASKVLKKNRNVKFVMAGSGDLKDVGLIQ